MIFRKLKSALEKEESRKKLDQKPNVSASGNAFRNMAEKELYYANTKYKETKDRLDRQDNLMKQWNNLPDDFSVKDEVKYHGEMLDKIKDIDLIPATWVFDHARQCAKLGMNDRAWGIYNQMITWKSLNSTGAVRREQAWLLKKEKRYSEAIEFTMMEYMEDSVAGYEFNREKFIKDIGVPVRRLKWDESCEEQIARFVQHQIRTKKYDEHGMVLQYRDYVKNF